MWPTSPGGRAAQAHAGQRRTHGAAAARGLGAVGVAGEHDGLAHAVALQDDVAGACTPGLEGLQQQRRRAADEQAHAAAGLGREAGLGQQPHVQRGHAHEDAGLGQPLHHGPGVEAVEPQHLGARQQRAVAGHEQPVHVEDGQRVDQGVAALGAAAGAASAPTPERLQHLRVAAQVAVREHRALAAAGGAAGVQDGGEVVVAAQRRLVHVGVLRRALQQRARAVVAEREHVDRAGPERNLRQPREGLGRAHHQRRLGVADEVLDLGRLVGVVQRQEHVAGAQHRQVQHQRLDALVHLHGHARLRGQVQRVDEVGHHRAGAVEVAPGVGQRRRRVDGLHRDGVEVGREAAPQGDEEVGVGHGMLRAWESSSRRGTGSAGPLAAPPFQGGSAARRFGG
jgi:hypothetical protein